MCFISYLFGGITVTGQIVQWVKKRGVYQPIKVKTSSEPVMCGTGLAVMMTDVPIYFLGVYREIKPLL